MKKRFITHLITVAILVALLPAVPFVTAADGDIDFRDESKIFTERILDDVELAGITSPIEAKQKISTVPDAIAYLDGRYETLWHSRHAWIEGGSTAELQAGLFLLVRGGEAGRSDMISAVAYLLSDDCDIGGIFGFRFSQDYPIMAVNYIQNGDQIIIFDPVLSMRADNSCRWDPLLPEARVGSFAEYVSIIQSDNALLQAVDSLFVIPDGQQVIFDVQFGWTTLLSPEIEPIYENQSRNTVEYIKPENIYEYKLSSILGGVTLSVDESKKLVGQSVSVLQEKIKTAGDLLLYMLTAKMLLNNGDEQIFADDYWWHYNKSAEETLRLNMGNCGRMANVANILLKDDYEEIGFILHSYYPGNGGGHVYNYIKYEEKIYIVDFSSYLFSAYSIANEFNFLSLDKLEDYSTRWNECYGGLAAIIAHTSEGTHLPNVWDGNGYYFPENAVFTVLFETPDSGYEVRTMPCPSVVPEWEQQDISNKSTPDLSTADEWAHDEIISAIDKGFVPEDLLSNYTATITRAEFCRMAIMYIEYASGKTLNDLLMEKDLQIDLNAFSDTEDPDILAAYALGITTGTGDRKFNPNGQFTREAAAGMIMNVHKALGYDVSSPPPCGFADADQISVWSKAGVDYCVSAGIMSGGSGNMFSPKGAYTRQASIVTFDNMG